MNVTVASFKTRATLDEVIIANIWEWSQEAGISTANGTWDTKWCVAPNREKGRGAKFQSGRNEILLVQWR